LWPVRKQRSRIREAEKSRIRKGSVPSNSEFCLATLTIR
jgi:hypothetical protein